MIRLIEINEGCLNQALALEVSEEQKRFVPSAAGILARTWVHRNENACAFAFSEGGEIVGLALVYNVDEEPACHYLMEFMVDRRRQNRGYGKEALRQIVALYAGRPKYPVMELSVDRENIGAIRVFQSAGFTDSGYADPNYPQYIKHGLYVQKR